MADTFEQKYDILRVDDLDPADEVRRQFERRSQEIREQAASSVRPTEVKLTDPSKSLKVFCPKCGAAQTEPFGDRKIASRLVAHGVTVEVYPNGGVILYVEGEVMTSSRRSRGLGTSGQLGFTRIVLTPDK